MKRITLRVLCEGRTERNFVTEVLAPHLRSHDVYAKAEGIGGGRGGIVPYEALRRAIQRDVGRSRAHEFVTTMIDLYGLGDYPGNEPRPGEGIMERVRRIEAGMAAGLNNERFVPYIQIHEFEALVFVDLDELEPAFPNREAKGASTRLRREIGSLRPEEINETKHGAPSKRLMREVPAYSHRKASIGPVIAGKIGLARLRAACPHFNEWVEKLELLAKRD